MRARGPERMVIEVSVENKISIMLKEAEVNFINILRAAFAPMVFSQKLHSQTAIRKKAATTLWNEIFECKLLMKHLVCLVCHTRYSDAQYCDKRYCNKKINLSHKFLLAKASSEQNIIQADFK